MLREIQATTMQGPSINQLFVNNWNLYNKLAIHSSFLTTIEQRSLFAQQIKYRSDKICNALATTENDSMVGKKSTNILDRGGIQRPF